MNPIPIPTFPLKGKVKMARTFLPFRGRIEEGVG